MLKSEQNREARRSLARAECVCGKKKTRGHVFCRGCYWRLPAGIQNGLYRPAFSAAFAEAYAAAVGLLRPEAGVGQGGDGRLF
jgi:hypothetical protein